MPWRLIYFIFLVFVFALFASFNLKNTCDISLLFVKFENIPVYITTLFSFIIGCAVTLPFLIKSRKKNKNEEVILPGIETINLKKEKRSFFGRKNKSSAGIKPEEPIEPKTNPDSNA